MLRQVSLRRPLSFFSIAANAPLMQSASSPATLYQPPLICRSDTRSHPDVPLSARAPADV
jgi:hypothetical protein